jgi:ABC-type multidrug transport system fused ATPase/permease subunit
MLPIFCAMVAVMSGSGTASDLSTFISTITAALADFTTSNLGTILVAALGITAGLAIAWFAYRFIVRKVSGAMKRGKL